MTPAVETSPAQSLEAKPEPAGTPKPRRHARTTPLSARGEPVVWITGMAMAICLVMILTLLGVAVWQGSRTFWPRPIDTLTLAGGKTLMGVPTAEEAFDAAPADRAEINRLRAAGALPPGALDDHGRPLRRLYRVGNKELRGQPFEWVPLYQIVKSDRNPAAVLLERREWGVWVGTPEAIVTLSDAKEPGFAGIPGAAAIAQGDALRAQLPTRLAESHARLADRERLSKSDVGDINARLEASRLRFRQVEIERERAAAAHGDPLPAAAWGLLLLGAVGAGVAAVALSRRLAALSATPSRVRVRDRVLPTAAWAACIALALPAALEHPWSGPRTTDADVAAARQTHEREKAALNAEYEAVLSRIRAIDADDARVRLVVREPEGGRFAPLSASTTAEPMRLSGVVRWVEPNTLSLAGKIGVYLDRWREFLLDDPREANTEGGIFPVIFGTVLLTLLLSVVVVPLGVVAALYMREYARQGPLISFVRICVNNLAGVPSIVYGVFGLGFFVREVGSYVDRGPPEPAPRAAWWGGVVALAAVTCAAAWLTSAGRPRPGAWASRAQRWMTAAAGGAWFAAAAAALALVALTPYFHGIFEARSGPTFGTPGLLWGAIVLALLTLPVVIVATEEAIAAVPRTMREGSYGCGASKWQTIRRIVLPRAMPGIMTGMILAMARGAGEVAPLMLVGAMKLAPELPLDGHFPYIHLNRSFMHLGFHIYDVGFQSPDSEAARPLVWTTTLVLVVIVLALNLAAIRVRARLRRKFVGGAF